MPGLSLRLLHWYNKHRRILPWRDMRRVDPYAIWVSEIMLQQTRVETVIPYYEKWLKRFPTIHALAGASERDVLNAWEGLGYYSRARNLHRAAKIVVEQYNSRLPRDLDELQKLPGIGKYTAGALASILFGVDTPALDGNLKRVYARLFDVTLPVDSSEGEALVWKLARDNLPKGKAADFNQALMDLGALLCLPKNPRCMICPVVKFCKARENGTQGVRPVKKARKAVPHFIHAAALIIKRGRVLLAQRPSQGLLGGMWEFPNARVDQDPARELAVVIRSAYSLRLRRRRGADPVAVVDHTYSHFKATVHAFQCELVSLPKTRTLKWIPLKDLNDYPMGKIDRQLARYLTNVT